MLRSLLALPLLALLVVGPSAADEDAATAGPEDDRARVLLLDYHAPIEHDVLLSHLCVEPCTASSGCPEELRREGADYWSEDFVVFRPRYLGSSARFPVQIYKEKRIDLLSLSGHHASGFSGNFGKGRFDTELLARDLEGLRGREDFFTSPSFVLLNGCWTDVESGFQGDPIDYVRHIIEDTTVRAGESDRLLAAIQQMAGEDDAYREIFPNACILGYEGTQIPGGLFEIYGQTNNMLRGLRGVLDGDDGPPPLFPLLEARRDPQRTAEVNREIDRQCLPTGWPCNLCRSNPEHYAPLAAGLAEALLRERRRIHGEGATRPAARAEAIERSLEGASLYRNVSWSCSDQPTGTAPVFPEPIDRAPHVATFLELLMVDFAAVDADTRHRIEAELVHLLGSTELDPATRETLRARLEDGTGAEWRRTFVRETVPRLSTFRQRDFFDFLAEIGCASCLEPVLDADAFSRVVRENVASQLRPGLGREIYETALSDPAPRVRWLAATRLHPSLGADLLDRAAADPDERVRATVAEIRSE